MEGDGMEALLTRALKLADAAVEWSGAELDAAWKAHAEAETASRANPSEAYEREQMGEASGRAWALAGQHGRLLDVQRMLDRARRRYAEELVSLRVTLDDALCQNADARAALCRIAQISNQYRERS